jgi:hypothetical protein
MYRQYRMMATGNGAIATGTVSDLDAATASQTHHVFQLCLSGTTAQRPRAGDADFLVGVPAAIFYLDTTLSAICVSDGKGAWRNPATGAAV